MKPTHQQAWLSFICAVCLAAANAAHAECDQGTLDIAGKFLGKAYDGHPVAASCAPSSADEHTTILGLAYQPAPEDGRDHADEKSLLVALVNHPAKRVVSAYQSTIFEDALTRVGDSSFKVDGKAYRLNQHTTAFGVVFDSIATGASCGDANWGHEMTLYVPQGKALRPVLNLAMTRQRALVGCLSTQSEGAVWEDAVLKLTPMSTRTHGHADLLVEAEITRASVDANLENAPSRSEKAILTYDGKAYYSAGSSPAWWMGAH